MYGKSVLFHNKVPTYPNTLLYEWIGFHGDNEFSPCIHH